MTKRLFAFVTERFCLINLQSSECLVNQRFFEKEKKAFKRFQIQI